MTSPVTVSERDLRTLLGIVSDDRSDLPAEGLPPSLLAELTDLIRCDVLSVFGLDSSEQSCWIGQEYPADTGPAVPYPAASAPQRAWRLLMRAEGRLRAFRRGRPVWRAALPAAGAASTGA